MYFTTILWWDKKKYSGGIKKAGDWNLEKKYIKYMDIFIFIYKEYLFFSPEVEVNSLFLSKSSKFL